MAVPYTMLHVIHERIPLREWLGHMSLFHANVQIRNESARTLHITMVLGEEVCADHAAALVPLHALEPGYSHLYSIPLHEQGGDAAARVTLAFRNGDAGDSAVSLLLRSGDRLRVASSSL
jgi:hypothetical protein